MSDRVAFIRERLAEDEAVARAAVCQCGSSVCTVELGWFRFGEARDRLQNDGAADQVVRHSPARILADVESKRRILPPRGDAVGLGGRQVDCRPAAEVAAAALPRPCRLRPDMGGGGRVRRARHELCQRWRDLVPQTSR